MFKRVGIIFYYLIILRCKINYVVRFLGLSRNLRNCVNVYEIGVKFEEFVFNFIK